MKKIAKNYYMIIQVKRKKVKLVRSHSKRRFINSLRTINWQNNPSVYLRVSYGNKLDGNDKLSRFFNDGWYEEENELLEVFNIFDNEE